MCANFAVTDSTTGDSINANMFVIFVTRPNAARTQHPKVDVLTVSGTAEIRFVTKHINKSVHLLKNRSVAQLNIALNVNDCIESQEVVIKPDHTSALQSVVYIAMRF